MDQPADESRRIDPGPARSMVFDIPGARGHGTAQHDAPDEYGAPAEACGRSSGGWGLEVGWRSEPLRYDSDSPSKADVTFPFDVIAPNVLALLLLMEIRIIRISIRVPGRSMIWARLKKRVGYESAALNTAVTGGGSGPGLSATAF